MKKIFKFTAFILSLCMMVSLCSAAVCVIPVNAFANTQTAEKNVNDNIGGTGDKSSSGVVAFDDGDVVEAIVTISGDSIADGFVQNDVEFSQFLTSDAAGLLSAASDMSQDEVVRGIERLGIDFKVLYSYQVVANALAIEVKHGDIKKIRTLSGVDRVEVAASRQLLFADESTSTDNFVSTDSAKNSAAEDMQLFSDLQNELTAAGTYDTSALGYNGKGMLIGIIDSSALPTHEAFSVSPTEPKYSDEGFLSTDILGSLNAKSKMSNVVAGDLFKSKKIPFAFDYQGGDTDLSGLDHGVRVAGIAAGNNGKDFFGSARDAQLAVFKVYTDTGSSASDTDIVAAIEDAVKIGVDVLNLSFGVPAGFMDEFDYEGVFESVATAGIILCASAGNNYTSAYKANSTDSAFVENPDTSVVAYPATHPQNLAVASFSKSGDNYVSTSWGPASDLTLKPEVTTAGLNITSATKSGGYGEQSGTSMASPNAAGGAAVVKQYLLTKGLSGTVLGEAVNSVITATAVPIVASGGYYSPRIQGAGFVSLKNAVNSGAYIKTDGTNKAKLEFGHDPDKTGIFSKEFTIKCLDSSNGEAQQYTLSGVVQTDGKNGNYISDKPHTLDAHVSFFAKSGSKYTLISDNAIDLAAGEELTVKVLITLSKAAKTYLKTFPSGGFVEGFVFVDSNKNGAGEGNSGVSVSDLSLPFLGFFGDWLSVPIFDVDTYGKGALQTKAENTGIYAGSSEVAGFLLGGYSTNDMQSAFKNTLTDEQKARLTAREEYSAIGLNSASQILYAQFGLLRNAANIHYALTDPVTGENVYKSDKLGDRIKGLYHTGGNSFNNKINIDFDPASLYDSGDISLKNNTSLIFSINASAHNSGSLIKGSGVNDHDYKVDDSISVPVFIDLETPAVVAALRTSMGEKEYLTITTRDNHYVRTIQMYYKKNDDYGTKVYRNSNYGTPVIAYSMAETVNTQIELSDDFLSRLVSDSQDGKLYIEVEDFARNKYETVLSGVAEGNLAWEKPADPALIYRESAAQKETYTGSTFEENGATYYTLSAGGYVLTDYQDSPSRTSFVVKEGTVRIAALAFMGAESLIQVTLPSTLKRIGEAAFADCDNLTAYKFSGMTAPLLETCLESFYGENRHPYNHFGDIYDPALLGLEIKMGAKGFDGWVWNNYFAVSNASGHKITFDSKGGTAVDGQIAFADEKVIAPAYPTREGYDFAGWYTTDTFAEEFAFGTIANDITLYAKWTLKQYSVTYVLEGAGETPVQTDIAHGGSFVVKGLGYELREQYKLVGWHDQSGKIYSVGAEYKDVEGNITLTAVWVKAVCTITFDTRGGSEIASISGYYGDAIPVFEDTQRDGYTFKGWYTDSDCTQKFEGGTFNGDLTLYAGWKKNGCSCATTSLPLYLSMIPLFSALSLLLLRRKKPIST